MPHSSYVRRKILPFTAIVGQEEMKLALILNAINPSIGGVLISGEKGTAKSTAVRALAELLPEIDVVESCPFNCNPYDKREMCDLCYSKTVNHEELEVTKRKMRVIDLPLGATEDRVLGALDIERAIKEGIKALEPGILADVNRGILYIDEVNLLDDHIADVLLDAAAMGVNVIEREGISVSHHSKFILIGTMNPEEGELRPQLLDRFGLQVSVESIDDPEKRVEIVKVVEGFESDQEHFEEKLTTAQKMLMDRIIRAKTVLEEVKISDVMLKLIATTCIELGVRTHRAEIVVARTARTIAAFDGRREATKEDIRAAMELALPHRMRRKPFERPTLEKGKIEAVMSMPNPDKNLEDPEEEHKHAEREQNSSSDYNPASDNQLNEKETATIFDIGSPIDVSGLKTPQRDKKYRRKIAGRRVDSLSTSNTGRYLRARFPTLKNDMDIALDATIRAAAPYQKERKRQGEGGKGIIIHDQDIREKVRVGKTPVACVFVVDASGSMGAMRRMESAKGAVLSLLEDSYQHRDEIGMVAFKGYKADILLPLCSSFDRALESLKELPTGGKTPLPAGLEKGIELLLLNKKRKNDEVISMLVLISDGRANVRLGDGSDGKGIKEEIASLAELMYEHGVHTFVIDTEIAAKSFINLQLGYCGEIANRSRGKYYAIEDLTAEKIYSVVANECRGVRCE